MSARELDENTITQAVIDRFKGASDARVKEVCTSLVKHLHDFVRDVRPSEDEWAYAIDFLTRTGKICDGNRQEYVLLSDTLGVSTLVDSINHPVSGNITQSTVLGPFWTEEMPDCQLGDDIHGNMKGEKCYVYGTLRSEDGTPLANAQMDVWHSDDDGFYDVQQLEKLGGPAGRGRFRTDKDGKFWFWSIKPTCYPVPTDGPVGEMLRGQGRHPMRPAHLHFIFTAPGHRKLVTHVFDPTDKYIDSDAVFGVKESLIREYKENPAGTAPDGTKVDAPYATITYDFVMAKTGKKAA
jgi:hydroxyquinol 1,2-dioxygenase